jgi:predicted Zn-dependent protease
LYSALVKDPFLEVSRLSRTVFRPSRKGKAAGTPSSAGSTAGSGFALAFRAVLAVLLLPFSVIGALWKASAALVRLSIRLSYLGYRGLRLVPLRTKVAWVGVIVLGLAVGWYVRRQVLTRGHRDRGFASIERLVARGDYSGALATSRYLATAFPDDERFAKRLRELEGGSADPDDAATLQLLMLHHFNARPRRLEEAAREARKLTAKLPDHWLARVILVAEQMYRPAPEGLTAPAVAEHQRRSRAIAGSLLADVPALPPGAVAADLNALLLAGTVYRDLRETERQADTVLAAVRTLARDQSPPSVEASVVLFELYCDALAARSFPTALADQWKVVHRFCGSAASSKEATPDQLRRLGRLEESQLTFVLPGLVGAGALQREEAANRAREVEEVLKVVWKSLQRSEPKSVEGWLGEATAQWRAGRRGEAVRVLDDGLAVGADRAMLTEVKARFLLMSDSKSASEFAESALLSLPGSGALLQVAAESAAAAGNRDRALGLCREARRASPATPPLWALAMELEICLDGGRPQEAVEAMRPARDMLVATPGGVFNWVKALAAAGRTDEATAEADRLLAAAKPALAIVAGYGLIASERPDAAAALAERMLRTRPDDAEVRLLAGTALTESSQGADGTWDKALATRALEHLEILRKAAPGNPIVANQIVWLYSEALGSPEDAYRFAAPLMEAWKTGSLPPALSDTLGTLLLRKGEAKAAKDMLSAAAKADPRNAAVGIHLAECLLALGEPAGAKSELERVKPLARRPADRLAVERLLTRAEAGGPPAP